MTPERWGDIVGMIKEQYSVTQHDVYDRDPDEGGGTEEIIIFDSPLGQVKLIFISKPVVLKETTLYSNRAGQETKIQKEFSDTEKVYTLLAFTWSDARDDWEKVTSGMFTE